MSSPQRLQKVSETSQTIMNVEREHDEQIYNAINDIMNPAEIKMVSRYEGRKSMQNAKAIMWVLGGGISLILGVIGIFNFVNVISAGVMVRKREFATLESIGMSKKQMRSMLRNEGVGYAIITILSSLTLGNIIVYGLFLLFIGCRKVRPVYLPVFACPNNMFSHIVDLFCHAGDCL